MYGKALKASSIIPAATVLPQLGNGTAGTLMSLLGFGLIATLIITSILAHR